MVHGQLDHARPEAVTLARVLTRHWQHHGRQLKSAQAVRYSLQRWNDFFPGALVSEITPARQRDFVKAMRAAGLSDGYIRRVLADGKSAINRAYREGEITAPPHIALVPEGEPRERIATLDEIAWLYRATPHDHIRLYLTLALGTLGRPEAVLQLDRSQADDRDRMIRLNPPGRRQNKKRRPTVPMCDTLAAIVARLPVGPLITWAGKPIRNIRRTLDRIEARAARMIRIEALARARTHRAAGDREAAWEIVKDARARARAILEITPYTLRHTMAAELRRRGIPQWELAGMMGHSIGYKTTERYAKFGPDHLGGAARAIEAYFADLKALLGGGALLGPLVTQVRASCVLPGQAPRAKTLGKLVEPRRIELLTSTMPL